MIVKRGDMMKVTDNKQIWLDDAIVYLDSLSAAGFESFLVSCIGGGSGDKDPTDV